MGPVTEFRGNERHFTWRRVAAILTAAVAVILIGSWLVRTYPNPGYQAGYEAAIDQGPEWVQANVDAAGGTAMALCDNLYRDADRSPGQPRYDRKTYIDGCGDAVDRLYGRHVPLVSDDVTHSSADP